MTTKQSFIPYAQRAILNESFLPDTVNDSKISNLPLLIHAQIADFGSEAINKMIDDINNNLDQLASQRPSFYSEDCACVIEQQPTWDMNEPSIPITSSQPSNASPHRCAEYNHEPLAYYSPAHNQQAVRYGIHILQEGVALVAKKIIEKCPKQPREKIILSAFYKLYAHEVAHGWIEDLVCLIDAATNEQAPVENRAYKVTQRRYNSYIYMEEAICNTAAHGWLSHFLDGGNLPNNPTLLKEFAAWMSDQPKGYCNFLPIKSIPYLSDTFITNVYFLLEQIYKPNAINQAAWSDELIVETISTYFGGQISYVKKQWIVSDCLQEQCFWSDNIPVHIESYNSLSPVCYEINVQQDVVLSGLSETCLSDMPEEVNGNLYLLDCPNLESFDGCPHKVAGTFYASNLPKITTIDGLAKIECDTIYIDCTYIKSFIGFEKIKAKKNVILAHIDNVDDRTELLSPEVEQFIILSDSPPTAKMGYIMLKYLNLENKENRSKYPMDMFMELYDAGFGKAFE